jgi:hypothetical protein
MKRYWPIGLFYFWAILVGIASAAVLILIVNRISTP